MSTTTESQPQRAMLSAEAELGIPSQPLTATPPFFQSVFSLFSRKASLPLSFLRSDNGHGCRARSIRVLRWPAMRGIMAAHLGRRARHFTEGSMTPNKKKVMLPHTMAKAGWDVLNGRDDIDAVGYDPYITMPELQVALKDTDGIALSLTPLKAPEIAVASRLRVAARIGVGYDAVEIPALTARGIPLMVVGTANSV